METGRSTHDATVRSRSASFRRARARLGGLALHQRRPSLAKEAGTRGGEATSTGYPDGKRAWAVAMAMRRWHGTPFHYVASRAPDVGSGSKKRPDPAAAPEVPKRISRRGKATGPQLTLF